MTEEKYAELIEDYLSDDYTQVYCLDINPMKQVLEITVDKYGKIENLNHYEDRQYYYGFKNIFMNNFALPIIENIDAYDYLLSRYPEVCNDLLQYRSNNPDMYFGDLSQELGYINYVGNWYKSHSGKEYAGCEPVSFYEWQNNELIGEVA